MPVFEIVPTRKVNEGREVVSLPSIAVIADNESNALITAKELSHLRSLEHWNFKSKGIILHNAKRRIRTDKN